MPVNCVNYFFCLTNEQITSLMKPMTPRDVKDVFFFYGSIQSTWRRWISITFLPKILGCSWFLFVLYGVEGFP